MWMPLYDICFWLYITHGYDFMLHVKDKELEGHVAISEGERLPGFSVALTEHHSLGGLKRKDSNNTEIYV